MANREVYGAINFILKHITHRGGVVTKLCLKYNCHKNKAVL
jgi:hypothetical protein